MARKDGIINIMERNASSKRSGAGPVPFFDEPIVELASKPHSPSQRNDKMPSMKLSMDAAKIRPERISITIKNFD